MAQQRTTANDPDFLATYGSTSRLAFLGGKKDEIWQEVFDTNAREVTPPRPPTNGRQRVVFHIDMDSFFATVAIQANPSLRGKPVAVCHSSGPSSNSEISSCTYEARKYGVHAGMWLQEARRKCPSLVTAPYDFEAYSSAAVRAHSCVLDATPHVKAVSIDECYADVTHLVHAASSSDEEGAKIVAERLRAAILAATGGCPASIGSAESCLLARVATRLAKPDGHRHLNPEDARSELARQPVDSLPGVGRKTREKLESIGVETCDDLLRTSVTRVREALGGTKLIDDLYSSARGVDPKQETWERKPRKSVGAQCSYGFRCDDATQFGDLAAKLARQAVERAEKLSVFPKVVKIGLKVWVTKDGNSRECKGGVGHGRCDVLSRTRNWRPSAGDVVEAVRAFISDLRLDPPGVRGLGVSLILDDAPAPPRGQPTIRAAFEKAPRAPPRGPPPVQRAAAPPPVPRAPAARAPEQRTPVARTAAQLAPAARAAAQRALAAAAQRAPAQPAPAARAAAQPPPAQPAPRSRGLVVVAVGLPGSGKSTFFRRHLAALGLERCCQDVLKRREKVQAAVDVILRRGGAAYVDRTNYNAPQRAHWVELARRRGAAVVVLRFRTTTDVCAQRCAARRNHEGGLDARNPAQCARVVNMLSGKFREVAAGEGFDRVIAAEDAEAALRILRPLLPRAEEAAPPPKRARVEPPPPRRAPAPAPAEVIVIDDAAPPPAPAAPRSPEIIEIDDAAPPPAPAPRTSEGWTCRTGDGVEISATGDTTPLEADFTALRKLRDDDASGALKEAWAGEDPRAWKDGDGQKAVTVKDGRVTKLVIYKCTKLPALPAAIGELGALTELNWEGCSSLATLPDTIGELKALTELNFSKCSSLAALPDAIGGLKALTTLILFNCSSLAALPGSIGKLGALETLDLDGCSSLTYPPEEMRGNVHKTVGLCCLKLLEGGDVSPADVKTSLLTHVIAVRAHDERLDVLVRKDPVLAGIVKGPKEQLEKDFASLRRLRHDDASEALKEYLGDSEDPREWKWEQKNWQGGKYVGNVVTVKNCRVTELSLYACSSLAELPAAIGELGALTELSLRKCSSLTALPTAIGELKALMELYLHDCSSLVALPAAIGELNALTTLGLYKCMSLVALPATIGELGALTTLDLSSCKSLVALPESIAGLDALTTLDLDGCTKMTFPPSHMHGRLEGASLKRVKRILANTTRFLAGEISVADADDEAKGDFLDNVIAHAQFADRLEAAVRNDPALADLTNDKGQRAIELGCLECRRAMQKALFFLGRYDVDKGPPEHRSATSLVVRALDYEAADDYGTLFDEFDKDGSGTLDADELDRLAARLGTNVEILELEGGSLAKDAFVAKCQWLFGKERKVVIKIFQKEEQWRNEKKARDDQQLDARYVVQTIPAPTDEEFSGALQKADCFGDGVGSHAIVMDAADRNLLQIYQQERPDVNAVRSLMRQVMECVDHLHEKGLVHGDIKMLNVVRLSLDNRLRLIDLDAAAKISAFGGEASYVGSKFSSAIFPPECFAKLDADQQRQFKSYFEGVDAELWKKVAPKVDKRGASYVVKTFSLAEDGAPKIDGLPYELVEASEAVDYWSLGALLFQLVTKESIVPANLDDDCVDGNAMAALASWNDDAAKKRLVAVKDAAAFDLASKLLVRDPGERAKFSITDTLAKHPFFNSESGDAEIKKKLNEMQTTLDAVDAKASSILRLSEENRDELQLTRRVLLKAVFEATEVSTPTTFVVLTDKLPELSDEQLKWIKTNVLFQDDGSGVLIRGEPPSWWADVEARYKDGKAWVDRLAKFKLDPKVTPDSAFSAIKSSFEALLPTTTLYFYLVDELTGEPIKGPGYPIEIKEPADKVSKLLPVMQVGMHAMSAYQGVAGVARMFGYPLPLVPEKWRKAAQGTVDLLKQESSVAAFGAVHKTVKAKDGTNQTVRGASLRELERFFKEKDPKESYAGLRRIGDPNDGTAVWTALDEKDLEKALVKRAAQRRTEEDFRRRDLECDPAPNTDRAPPSGVQGQISDAKDANTLARANVSTSGTCNNMTCYCAIA